jgi:hypothetical protein
MPHFLCVILRIVVLALVWPTYSGDRMESLRDLKPGPQLYSQPLLLRQKHLHDVATRFVQDPDIYDPDRI